MSQITVTFTLDTAKVSKFGMGVVSVNVPAGYALAGKLAWAVEQGTLAVKQIKTNKRLCESENPAMDANMFKQFQQFMAMQGNVAAKPVTEAPAANTLTVAKRTRKAA